MNENLKKNFHEVWWKVQTNSYMESRILTLLSQKFKEGDLMDPSRHNEYTTKWKIPCYLWVIVVIRMLQLSSISLSDNLLWWTESS